MRKSVSVNDSRRCISVDGRSSNPAAFCSSFFNAKAFNDVAETYEPLATAGVGGLLGAACFAISAA